MEIKKMWRVVFNKDKDGFTLIELLVAVAVFTIVVVAMSDIFLISNGGLARVFSQQNVQDSARFMMESMAKDLRMSAIVSSTDGCIFSFCGTITIKSYLDDPVNGEDLIYTFDAASGNLTMKRGNQPAQILNSAKVKVSGAFKANKTGLSPRVTIIMKVEGRDAKVAQRGKIELQTTISSHRY